MKLAQNLQTKLLWKQNAVFSRGTGRTEEKLIKAIINEN